MSIIRFLKNWTLPVSIIAGALCYFIGRELPLSVFTKEAIIEGISWIQPILLFCMLFVAFCKVSPSALKPRKWHAILVTVQSLLFALCCLYLHFFPDTMLRYATEGFMLAIVCPTATACAVVTQKLGGDSATTTAYTIFINLVVALLIPALLPLIHPYEEGFSFQVLFLSILHKVFPLLVVPLMLAWFVRYCIPKLHRRIITLKDFAFYLWAVALALAIAVTCRALAHSDESLWHVGAIALSTIVACGFQFAFGKMIGGRYGNRMEGGQAMGQKNTIFIIWLAYTFVSPLSATAGGFYSIWHNVVNSWQLYKYRKQNE